MSRLSAQMIPSLRKVVGATLTNYSASPAQTATITFSVQDGAGIAKVGTPTAGAESGVAEVYLRQVSGNSALTLATATSGASIEKMTSANSASATALAAVYKVVMGSAGSIAITAAVADATTTTYQVRITAGGSTIYAGVLTVGDA